MLRIEEVNQQVADLERKLIYTYIRELHKRILVLENKSDWKSLEWNTEFTAPNFSCLTSQAVTMSQMLEPKYADWCERLNDRPNFHRKHWEYIYILKALDQEKKINKGMEGLGFGVGKDPIVAYMVKNGCRVVATDLDPQNAYEKGWAQSNQYSEKLINLNERGICSDAKLKANVQLRNVDMNNIPHDLLQGQFDFIWSACAYEHLGSIEKGLDFIIKSMDALKPGGIAVHTTELNVSSQNETVDNEWTVLFRRKDFEELADRLRKLGHSIDLNFYLGDQPLDQFYDVPTYSEFNHLKLKLGQFITTSFGIIIKKRS
jgi:SAM-dependent methyltransferase